MSDEVKLEKIKSALDAMSTILRIREELHAEKEQRERKTKDTSEVKEFEAIIEWGLGTEEEREKEYATEDGNDLTLWSKKHPNLPPLPCSEFFGEKGSVLKIVHMCRYYWLENGLIAQR